MVAVHDWPLPRYRGTWEGVGIHLPAPHYMLSNMSLMALIAGVEARPVDGGAAAFKYLGDLGDA